MAVAVPASATPSIPAIVAGGGATIPDATPIAATSADLGQPTGIALGATAGTLLVADSLHGGVLQLNSDGTIQRIVGTGTTGCATTTATGLSYTLDEPTGLAPFGSPGDFIIADSHCNSIRKASGGPPDVSNYAGNGTAGYLDATPATDAEFNFPTDVEPISATSYLVADASNYVVRLVDTSADAVSTVGATMTTYIGEPIDISAASATDYYVAALYDTLTGESRVWRVSSGSLTRATDTPLVAVSGVQALKDGGFLVYEGASGMTYGRILRVAADGTVTTVLGGLDGGRLALTSDGLYLSETNNLADIKRMPALQIVTAPSDGALLGPAPVPLGFASWDAQAAYECSVDLGAFAPCPSPLPDPGEGQHHLSVRAVTDTDRVSPVLQRTWEEDATPPYDFSLVAPDDGAALTEARPAFTWQSTLDSGQGASKSEGATSGVDRYELWIDGAKAGDSVPASACAATCSGQPAAALSDGPHSWEVRAVDRVGNARTTSAQHFSVAIPPTAALSIAPQHALVGRTVTFDGTASNDPNGPLVHFEWDLDGDGSYETETGATSTVARSYTRPATLAISLRVTDSGGLQATASGTLVVSLLPPAGKQLGVSINDGAQFTNDPEVTIFAIWPTFASDMLVSNDGGFKLAQSFPLAPETPWKLDSSGPERLPKTIYVRFLGGGQTSETYQDDVILDQTPPKVVSAELLPTAPRSATAARVRTLRLKATDNVSGVGRVQVTTNKRKPGRLRAYKRKLKVVAASHLYVRVRDRAGNFSTWKPVRG